MQRLDRLVAAVMAAWLGVVCVGAPAQTTGGGYIAPSPGGGVLSPSLPGFVEPAFVPAGSPMSAADAMAITLTQQRVDVVGGPPTDRGLFQGVDLMAELAPRFESDGLGRATTSATVKFGLPTPVGPLLVSPRYGLHLLDGPSGLDVPAAMHDLELGFATFRQLSARWSARGVVNLGVYGDEDSLGDADAFRVTGFGMAIYEASPAWQWAIGVGYLNNQDFSVLPIFGVIHDRGWVKYELMLPRPRVVWTLPSSGACRETVYLAGELGGGTWAARRASGATDVLQVSRFGAILGYEIANDGASTWRYEIGYLFGRDIEYRQTGEALSLDDSLIARVGWSF